MNHQADMQALVELVSMGLRSKMLRLATVESCTGGLIGAAMTSLAGSSDIYSGGFITYSNALKQELVGVHAKTLDDHGAVSSETAREMALGGQSRTGSDLCIAVTGIAGPDGGTVEKPVGTVWIAVAGPGGGVDSRRCQIAGSREVVRDQSVLASLELVLISLGGGMKHIRHEAERVAG